MPDPDSPTLESVSQAIKGLGQLEWRLHQPPWKYLILVKDDERTGKWKIRNEERKQAIRIGKCIQEWVGGLELDEDEVTGLHDDWKARLMPMPADEDIKEMWEAIEERRGGLD